METALTFNENMIEDMEKTMELLMKENRTPKREHADLKERIK